MIDALVAEAIADAGMRSLRTQPVVMDFGESWDWLTKLRETLLVARKGV